MNVFIIIVASLASALAGMVLGVKLEESAWRRAGKRRENRKRITTSKMIALCVLLVDAVCTFAVLGLCYIAIDREFSGALPYLTTLIGALQAVTAIVLTAYFNKAKAENSKGGIVYDYAMGNNTQDSQDITGGVG